MSNSGSHGTRRSVRRAAAASVALAAAALAAGAGPAGAHGGDTALVHSCINNGNVKIVAANESCKQNEVPLDWARAAAAGTTYTAGSGLSLSPTNEFSVTGAPWGGLTGVPAGFADGVDDEGPAVTWGNLTGIPSELLDGDDDGSAAVSALRTSLGQDDAVPDQPTDPVSFSRIKDLSGGLGGRITGDYIRSLTIQNSDLAENSITADKIADRSVDRADIADDAVNADKIADGSIQAGHFAPRVLDRTVITTDVDPPSIPAGTRVGVPVTPLGGGDFEVNDIVVVSPPATFDAGLVYAGSDVLPSGMLVVYLHNIAAAAIDAPSQMWTIRQLRTGG